MLSQVGQRTASKARTRVAILEAARMVMSRQGFDAMTARDVAVQAKVAVGTVFLHFPTMAKLAEALLDEVVAAGLKRAQTELPDGLIPQLVHMSRHLYDAYGMEPELSRQVIGASLFEVSPGSPSDVRMREFRTWVMLAVNEAVERGDINPSKAEGAFEGFFSLYFGVLVIGLRGEASREDQVRLLSSLLAQWFGTSEPGRQVDQWIQT